MRSGSAGLSFEHFERIIRPFEYYEQLSLEGKQRFYFRCDRLSRYLRFKGMQGLKIDLEKRILIAASITQVTFGFAQFHIPAFRRVLVYPQSFYHAGWKKWMKGFAAGNGVIALSWEDFRSGYRTPDDNYNLGMHEIAHALHLNLSQGHDSDSVFQHFFNHWEAKSLREFENLSDDSSHFLRHYGGTNMHEFFAVCVEHFFESPEPFQKALPDLYARTCLLMNQDPLAHDNDYRLNEELLPGKEEKEEKDVKLSLEYARYRERSWHWSLTLASVGIFISPLILYMFTFDTLVYRRDIIQFAVFTSALGFVQYPWFRRKGWIDYAFFFLIYAIFGVGLNLATLGFAANSLFPLEHSNNEYKITRVIDEPMTKFVFFEVNDEHLNDHIEHLYLEKHQFYRVKDNPVQSVNIELEKGLLGYGVIKRITPIYSGKNSDLDALLKELNIEIPDSIRQKLK